MYVFPLPCHFGCFLLLQVLDADKGERLESSNGRVASRDIVQFVPFRDVHSKYHSSTLSVCMKTKVSIEYTFCFLSLRTLNGNKFRGINFL